MKNKKLWLCANLAGLGSVRLKKLLKDYGSIEKVFSLSHSELADAEIPKKLAVKIQGWEQLPWKNELDFCERNGISVITMEEDNYPALLKQIFDPPILLFVKGKIPAEGITFAIVGTRNPSVYGLKMAEKFATELSYYGFVIISGMARGVDTAAHKGALKGGGKTIAVTGCGFKQCYPRENERLSKEISRTGAVITEFTSETPPEPQMVNIVLNQASIFLKQGKHDQSLAKLKEAQDFAKGMDTPVLNIRLTKLYSDVYAAMQDFEKAYKYQYEFREILEKKLDQQSKNSISITEADYYLKKIEKQAQIYKVQNTELKKKNKIIRQTTRDLKESNRTLSGTIEVLNWIIAVITHDVRAPLGNFSRVLSMMLAGDF